MGNTPDGHRIEAAAVNGCIHMDFVAAVVAAGGDRTDQGSHHIAVGAVVLL